MFYFLTYIGIGIWVYFDAKKRRQPLDWAWAGTTALLGPLVVPVYIAKRNLKPNEVREGGVGWNIAKYFAIFWTVTMAVATIAGIANASAGGAPNSDAQRAGVAIGAGIGLVILFVVWFFVTAGALMVGVFLKKNSIVERGPTGALADPAGFGIKQRLNGHASEPGGLDRTPQAEISPDVHSAVAEVAAPPRDQRRDAPIDTSVERTSRAISELFRRTSSITNSLKIAHNTSKQAAVTTLPAVRWAIMASAAAWIVSAAWLGVEAAKLFSAAMGADMPRLTGLLLVLLMLGGMILVGVSGFAALFTSILINARLAAASLGFVLGSLAFAMIPPFVKWEIGDSSALPTWLFIGPGYAVVCLLPYAVGLSVSLYARSVLSSGAAPHLSSVGVTSTGQRNAADGQVQNSPVHSLEEDLARLARLRDTSVLQRTSISLYGRLLSSNTALRQKGARWPNLLRCRRMAKFATVLRSTGRRITSRCCGPARVASVCCSTPRPAPRVALPATEFSCGCRRTLR